MDRPRQSRLRAEPPEPSSRQQSPPLPRRDVCPWPGRRRAVQRTSLVTSKARPSTCYLKRVSHAFYISKQASFQRTGTNLDDTHSHCVSSPTPFPPSPSPLVQERHTRSSPDIIPSRLSPIERPCDLNGQAVRPTLPLTAASCLNTQSQHILQGRHQHVVAERPTPPSISELAGHAFASILVNSTPTSWLSAALSLF